MSSPQGSTRVREVAGKAAWGRALQPARLVAIAGRLESGRASPLVVATIVVVLSWPVQTNPTLSLDLEWIAGLHRAAAIGLRFGSDVTFTYGPVGFLGFPTPFLGITSALALAATFAAYLAAAWLLLASLRRHLPLAAAACLTLVLGRTFSALTTFDALQFAIVAAGVWLLRQTSVRYPLIVAVAAGVVSALAVLGKLNTGVFAAAMALVVVAAISPRPRRDVAVLVASAAIATLAIWIGTAQQLGDLAAYVRSSLDVISGYSEAMSLTKPALVWTYTVFAFIAAVAAWAAWTSSSGWTTAKRLALGALVALLLFATWKSGYVRFHAAEAILIASLTGLILLPSAVGRGTLVALVGSFLIAFLGITQVTPASYAGMPASARSLAQQVSTAAAFWAWEGAARRSEVRLASELAVPQDVLAALDGVTVDFDPLEAGLAAAYPSLRWRPMPVLQTYSAYTPLLDQLDAELLRSASRPQRILRHVTGGYTLDGRQGSGSIDGRFYWFESPAATVERMCRYREVLASADWQVLADTGRACGAPTPLGVTVAAAGATVPVPTAPAGDLVVVRVDGVNSGLAARLRAILWRSPSWYVTLNGMRYRLVPGTASQGLLLSVPAASQGSPRFAFGPAVKTIAIANESGRGGELTYTFLAVPMPTP